MENLGGGIGKPSKLCKNVTVYIERTHSNCRSPQFKYVYEGGGILWAHSQGGKEITSSGKIDVNTKVGVTAKNNGVQGLSGSNQLLFLLFPQLIIICLSTNGKATSGKVRREEMITKCSGL